ncbi:MAG: FAD-dependent oxidoreductase [Bacillota bacterium]|nr:FAD-dependent oxidoreductase [Bacillota bacterium]
MERADVIVVGAGVMGCSVVYHLARERLRVLVLDKGDIGGGTSSACDGFVVSQSKSPGPYLDLAMKSAGMLRSLHDELGADVGYRQTGSLIVIRTASELDFMQARAAELAAQGVRLALLSRRGVQQAEPLLDGDLLGATVCAEDGTVDPMALNLAFQRVAARLGARFLPHTPVKSVLIRSGRVCGAETEAGVFEAPCVVLATGVGLGSLVPDGGPPVIMKPLLGQLLVTEPLPPVLRHCCLDARYIVLKGGHGLHEDDGRDDNEAGEAGDDPVGVGFGLEQTIHGNILIGNTREAPRPDRATSRAAVQAIARYAASFAPRLRGVHIIRTFAGLRPYTVDGLPLIGPVEEVPGLFLCGGHGSDGITLSPISGKLIAEMIITGETPAECLPVLPGRLRRE